MTTAPEPYASPRGPVVLLLAHAGDLGARRLAAALAGPADQVARAARQAGPGTAVGQRRPRPRVLLVHDVALARARWWHEVGTGAGSAVELRDGTVLTDDPARSSGRPLGAVVCRLAGVVPPQFVRSTTADREYAGAELTALLASWLRSLRCPVLNEPSPAGLGGVCWGSVQWAAHAAAAGFAVSAVRLSSSARAGGVPGRRRHLPATADLQAVNAPSSPDPWPPGHRPALWPEPAEAYGRLLVAGPDVVGDPAAAFAGPARRLASTAGCRLLEVRLLVPPGAAGDPSLWRFAGADPVPPLDSPEHVAAAARAVAGLLRSRDAPASARS